MNWIADLEPQTIVESFLLKIGDSELRERNWIIGVAIHHEVACVIRPVFPAQVLIIQRGIAPCQSWWSSFPVSVASRKSIKLRLAIAPRLMPPE